MHRLELSTQLLIKEAEKRGCQVEIVDPADNFIRITKANHMEYIKQATRTSLDSYISALIMENKLVTKEVLNQANINTPRGRSYLSKDTLLRDVNVWNSRAVVVKPKSTNFGKGITILQRLHSYEELAVAAELGFQEDSEVIVEEYFEGKEYRLLVIGDQVRAVLHRIPANVKGDGKSTIAELINLKNQDPNRGTGYVKPLEKLKMGIEESVFLKQQDLDFTSVPAEGKTVYLRKNSNISTGGDSIDMTEELTPWLKEVAVKAANAVGAKICGVDMLINKDGDYTIIELNFNPALHIHDFPAVGENRNVEGFVLDELGFN